MAAQGYQESTLDQTVESPGGDRPDPGHAADREEELNVGDISEIDPNIHAGVKFMRFMDRPVLKDEPIDQLNKSLMTFAA